MLLAACCPLTQTWAQAVKEVSVSHGNAYTDHIALKDDSKDMDLMVKLVFDEPTNTLSLTLISYRDLFVFPTDATCRQVVRHRKINPDKLPFVVNADADATFQLTKDYWKSIAKPRRKHVFRKWVETVGLTPQPVETKMVNDFVSQDFLIDNKADAVELTLRDVLMMEQEATTKVGRRRYNIVWGKDLNTVYRVYIRRNPCFGLDEELAAADNQLGAVRAAYKNLHSRYGSGWVANGESLQTFKEMKQLLQGQYPKRSGESACPDLQAKWDAYNLCVDSIAALNCRVRPAESHRGSGAGQGSTGSQAVAGFNAGYILTQARQIDNAVSRWLVSKDETEREDLRRQCQEIIRMVKPVVARHKGGTAAQQQAVKIFNRATAYFYSTCH